MKFLFLILDNIPFQSIVCYSVLFCSVVNGSWHITWSCWVFKFEEWSCLMCEQSDGKSRARTGVQKERNYFSSHFFSGSRKWSLTLNISIFDWKPLSRVVSLIFLGSSLVLTQSLSFIIYNQLTSNFSYRLVFQTI